MQSNHLESDAWEEDVLRFIEDKTEVTTKEIWELAIQGDKPISKVDQSRISKIMRVAGWGSKVISRNGVKVRVWRKE